MAGFGGTDAENPLGGAVGRSFVHFSTHQKFVFQSMSFILQYLLFLHHKLHGAVLLVPYCTTFVRDRNQVKQIH